METVLRSIFFIIMHWAICDSDTYVTIFKDLSVHSREWLMRASDTSVSKAPSRTIRFDQQFFLADW